MTQLVAYGVNLDKPIGDNGRGIVEEKNVPDFKLIPLFKPLDPSRLMASKCNPLQYEIEVKKILQCWEHLVKDMEVLEVIAKAKTNLTDTLNSLLSGDRLLWMGFVDGKYCGFVTTRIEREQDHTLKLNIIQCFIKTGTDSKLFYTGLNQLREFAINAKCEKISVCVSRKGERKLLEPIGFKQAYIQYDLVLKE